MHQRIRENHLGDKWCFYLKQLVLSVGGGTFKFFNWLGSYSSAACGHCRNTKLAKMAKTCLPRPAPATPLAGKQKATSISDVPFQQDELRATISPISLRVAII